jgi:hypothetical protein
MISHRLPEPLDPTVIDSTAEGLRNQDGGTGYSR